MGSGGSEAKAPDTSPDAAGSDKRAPRARRGSIIPLIIGRDKVEPLTVWAGNLNTEQETIGGGGGGKGGGGAGAPAQKVTHYEEDVVHVLCVGPAYALHRIWINEKNVFEGEINSSSHPSGTEVDVGKWGSFRIYWGERGQPVNLGGKVGVASRWPHICYLEWVPLKLGEQRAHPAVEYDIETRPIISGLVKSQPFFESALDETGKSFAVVNASDGIESDDESEQPSISVSGNKKAHFKPDSRFLLEGNTGLGEDVILTVHHAKYNKGAGNTKVYIDGDLEGLTPDGTAKPLEKEQVSGINLAHGIFQLMFGKYPHGGAFPEWQFDVHESLEDLGVSLSTGLDKLPARIVAKDGEKLGEVLEGVLADISTVVPFSRGLFRFFPIREPEGDIPHIPAEIMDDPLPEIESLIEPPPIDRVVFWYEDRKRKFAKKTIPMDNDGVASIDERSSPREVFMRTAIDGFSGLRIAERRKPEELSPSIPVRIVSGRETRDMFPGQPFTADLVGPVLRVDEIEVDFDSGAVTIDAKTDVLGLKQVAEDDDDIGDNEEEGTDTVEDELQGVVEIGCFFEGAKKKLAVPRVRGGSNVVSASVWVSKQAEAGYVKAGNDFYQTPGGALTTALPADGDKHIDEVAAYFEALGPDIAGVLDLTGNDDGWYGGVQVALIRNLAGTWEACFLKRITQDPVTGDWGLEGLIRGRYHTSMVAHPIGSSVFLFTIPNLFTLEDSIVKPGATVYVKIVPEGSDPPTLDEVDPIAITVQGLWKGAYPPVNVHLDPGLAGHLDIFNPADGTTIKWGWRTCDEGVGAGAQGYGEPSADAVLKGHFNVFIMADPDEDGGLEIVRTWKKLTNTEVEWTSSEIASDFPEGVPPELTVRVKHVVGSGVGSTDRIIYPTATE